MHGSVEGSVHGSAFGSVHGLTNGMSGGKPQPSGFPLTAWLNQTAGVRTIHLPSPHPCLCSLYPQNTQQATARFLLPHSALWGAMPVGAEPPSHWPVGSEVAPKIHSCFLLRMLSAGALRRPLTAIVPHTAYHRPPPARAAGLLRAGRRV